MERCIQVPPRRVWMPRELSFEMDDKEPVECEIEEWWGGPMTVSYDHLLKLWDGEEPSVTVLNKYVTTNKYGDKVRIG